ncbi:adenylate cyclase type 10 isoform X2 [Ictalurus punctatus]|uniref:Adenylate cyclase type 10 isoform X2 n=1 Tax=Ictalurus punctatus TaxID=7998 RepID=A0A9F7THB8_ICTPU|nr:adenylate cyclase type 10 isoform X2 [Ictalurus punctatus]
MNFDIIHISQSGTSQSELYRVLSSEGIRAAEVKTVVLLYLSRKERCPWQCNHRSAELAACIHAAGGYVVHHTGDAILAEWVEENVQMSDTISHVLQCAFTTLKVEKLRTLSAGEFTKITIGDKFCAVIGPAVEEIRSIQARMQNGDIILCPEAWRQCDRQNLTVKNIENKEAVKVRCSTEQQSISVDDLHHYNTDIHMTKNPITYLITHKEREAFIGHFMIQTACNKIQANQQREAPNPGLPEIWPTTIMFMYLQFVLTQTDLRFGRQEVSETIAEQMFRCRGKICNVFFFEEGCMFVCAVGLPGDKRQDKTAQAVQAAFRIHETCHQQIDSVSSISIGVATGRVKYKFEQSPLRECCRVYGEKVRGAAELSRSNPGIVSCDEPTRHFSLLPLSTFRPLKRSVFVAEPGLSSSEMDSRRLAFAIKQTMLDEEWEVVKCASVIGHFNDNNFNFELLKITLPCMNEPELIIHLRSLFRAGVFKCASEPRNVSSTKTC